jgi:hypothetical protein
MTVVHLGNQSYQGLTADIKPTNVPAGAIFRDTQTDIVYEFNGSSWDIIIGNTKTETLTNKTLDSISNTVKNVTSYDQTIFKISSTYYLYNSTTGAIISNSDPGTIFQTALTAGGSVFVKDGTYTFSGSFAGLDFPVNPVRCHFQMSPNAFLTVPNGYTGYIFRMVNGSGAIGCSNNTLEGGLLQEAGTPQRLWTGIILHGTGSTQNVVFQNTIKKIQINYPKYGIHFYCDGSGTSIISNYIEEMIIYGATNGFIFEMSVAYNTGINGFHRNRFTNCIIQYTSEVPSDGIAIKDIMHRENSFIGIYTVDYVGASRATATIHADASDTLILGGTMTALNYVDNSTTKTTKIIDQNRHVQTSQIRPSDGTGVWIIPTGTSTTFSLYDAAQTRRLYIQRASTGQYNISALKVNASGALEPIVFNTQDLTAGGGLVESFRVNTDSTLRVYTDRLKLLDSNQSHNYNIIVGDISADRNITLPILTANDTFVFAAHTQTLTNKTLTTPTISSIVNSGTLTLPTSTDTLVGRNTTDTLTNKTINWNNNTVLGTEKIVGHVNGKKYGGFSATSAASGWGILAAMTSVGTGGSVTLDNDYGSYIIRTTGAVIGNACGHSYSNPLVMRKYNPLLTVKCKPSVVTNNRMYIGWKSGSNSSPAAQTDDPLANISGVMFLQRAGDTTWQICSNNGSASSTIVDTTTSISSTIPTVLMIRGDETNSKWQWSTNSGSSWTDVTGNVPDQTTNLYYVGELQTNEAVSHGLHTFGIEIMSDK